MKPYNLWSSGPTPPLVSTLSEQKKVALFYLFCLLLQFLLLLGCFALFWSLYYTLEVTLGHVDFRVLFCLWTRCGGRRTRRGHRGRGVEESLLEEDSREEEEHDSGVELQAVMDSEAKEVILNRERHEG